MSDPLKQIVELAGCSEEAAEKAYRELQDIVAAIDLLLGPPVCAGDKYIPPKSETNRHLDAEQKARCERGRELAEKINAGRSSVAHSAIQSSAQKAPVESQSVELPSPDASGPPPGS